MPKGNPAITHNSTKLATFNKVKVSKILWGFRKIKLISVPKTVAHLCEGVMQLGR